MPTRRLGELPCDFAGYRLMREIASGGMGIVFEALDVKLKRTVAMKVIRNAYFATHMEAARFRAEMEAIAQLLHPHIVPVYDSGEEDGTPFFTMRLAEDGSLAEQLQKSGAMSVRVAAAMMIHIARAVQHAHDRGVLHRDLKPGNVLLDAEGGPLLADFGLAKQLDGGGSLITRSGSQVGTLHYMSPEQASGGAQEITTASDVWALGVMLFQMLTNTLPFDGASAVEILHRITQDEPGLHLTTKTRHSAASAVAKLHPDLATLVQRCLEKKPEKRLRSAGFLAEELERFLAGDEIESRPVTGIDLLWRRAVRHKVATAALFVAVFSLLAGTVISTWQAVKAHKAENAALKQKAESDEIARIVLDTVRSMDEHVIGKEVDPDQWREELLRRMAGFGGDPRRKAAMLAEVATMMKQPADVEVFRVVLSEVEPLLDPNDPLLWSLRYRLTLKKMLSAAAAGPDAAAARDELRRILVWQQSHLEREDAQICKTQYALAEELIDEVRTPEALQEAESLLKSCVEHYRRKNDVFDEVTANIQLMTAIFDQGRQQEALQLGRDTVAQSLKARGDRHALTGRVFGRLAKHCRDAGLIEESILHARRALDIYWHTVGPDYVKANATLDALADTLEKHVGDEAVLELRQDALRACDQDLGPMHGSTLRQAAKVIEALRDLKRLEEARSLAEAWLDRVRSGGSLPPDAAAIVVNQFQTLQDLGQSGEAEELLQKLPAMLQVQKWDESTSFSRWEALANRLLKAGKAAEAVRIVKHLLEVLPKSHINERKAAELRPELQKRLKDIEGDGK
ncbi:MAG: protein kinase domain-containing protein [Prosthecobacter sp.]|uniref:serine/threonine-protein kinase n=1 Tax=Prosthecobacter sp. TaxID=1965333 RepID=UPI0038FDE1AC